MTQRETELIEAVQLLHALCKPVELIARQTGLSAAEVRRIIDGKPLQTQRTLFEWSQRCDEEARRLDSATAAEQ